MQEKFKEMFRVFEIMAFEHVGGISLSYDENTCDPQSTCYQTVPRLHIWLEEIFLTQFVLA